MKRTLTLAVGLLALAFAVPAAAHDGGAGDDHFQRQWEKEQWRENSWRDDDWRDNAQRHRQ